MALTPAEPLLMVAARMGFHKLPQVPLFKLAHECGCDLPAASTFFNTLKALIAHVVPFFTEEEIFQVLQLRTVSASDTLALFQKLDIESAYEDKSDQKVIEAYIKNAKKEEEAVQDFTDELHELSTKLGLNIDKKADAGPPAEMAKPGSSASSSAKFVPGAPAANQDITLEQARAHAPPNSRIYKDHYNGRWLIWIEPHGCRSRSWSLTGEIVSLANVLLWAWNKAKLMHGYNNPHDWIVQHATE